MNIRSGASGKRRFTLLLPKNDQPLYLHHMRKIHVLLALVLTTAGCGPSEFHCSTDGKLISDVDKAFVVAAPRATKFDALHFDEVPYEIMSVDVKAKQEGVPADDIAMGYHDRIYCSMECAEPEFERKNHVVDSIVGARDAIDLKDSLVMDSIQRGLIK